ncbi:MAG TPA: response regulator [Clostridia bacterium]|nr:response regulator [Clostridia bacterium]
MQPPTPKVLVVDDHRIITDTLVTILQMNGFDPSGTYSGREAIRTIDRLEPDIALCDINLADMSGVDVAIQIQERFPKCRILLLSGDSSSASALQRAGEEGLAFETVAKPIAPLALLNLLRRTSN